MNEAIFLDKDGQYFVVGKTVSSQLSILGNIYKIEIGEFEEDGKYTKVTIIGLDDIKNLHEFLTEFIAKSEVK